jgi:hypothetical protein
VTDIMLIRKVLPLAVPPLLLALSMLLWWRHSFPDRAQKPRPQAPAEERLEVLACLDDLCKQPAVTRSIPTVERWMKDDPDTHVRWRATELRCLIAHYHEDGVCPPSVVRTLFDEDREMHGAAETYSGLFKEVSPEAMDLLLTALAQGDRDVRRGALSLLDCAAARDDRARRAIRDAREDKDFGVRHNAHCNWFKLTGDLDDLLPYCLRVQVEYGDLPPVPPGSSEEAARERCSKELMQTGTFDLLQRQGEERTDEVAKALLRHLEGDTPILRQGAAVFLGAVSDENINARRKARGLSASRPVHSSARFSEEQVSEEQAGRGRPAGAQVLGSPKLLARLSELKVEEALHKREDGDQEQAVREAAAAALKSWSALQEEGP